MTTWDLSAKHPEYSLFLEDWVLMHDAYKGERQVKKKGPLYLPYTQSQVMDGAGVTGNSAYAQQTNGDKAYNAYRKRARFPNFTREAVQMAIGMMHARPPKIKLPKRMEGIRSNKGEKLEELLRRINTEQLLTGRLGLMADLPTMAQPGEVPYLATYIAERIINWDDGRAEQLVPQKLNMVVLNESEYERIDTFDWEKQEKYRVLVMGPDDENVELGIYRQAVFDWGEGQTYDESLLRPGTWMGKTLDHIPFVIINSCDLIADVDDPPLLDLGNMCMTIYRTDADYRQSLFMQSQDTLVTVGANFDEDEAVRTGAGQRIDVPMGGDAKYIGVESTGLAEQRGALENLEARAGTMGAQTLDSTSRERESGSSMAIRVAARTADLTQIADAGAAGLEAVLRSVAEWMSEDPEEVEVKPNKEFGDLELTGQTMVEMATARTLGFPISAETLHRVARERKLTKMSYEEEIEAAKKEEAEDHPFKIPEDGNADMAGAEQNSPGDDTKADEADRKKAQQKSGAPTRSRSDN